jgi:recombinational DNA repair protein (RecF pathway)
VQKIVAIFSGPSLHQAELLGTSTHPLIVAQTARDLIEDGESNPALYGVFKEALLELNGSSVQPK